MTHPKLSSDILLPPNDKQLIYTTNALGWLSENEIYYSVSFDEQKHLTLDELMEEHYEWRKNFNNKVCMLAVFDGRTKFPKEQREFILNELPNVIKALALIADSTLAKIVGNFYFGIKKQDYPSKVFSNVADAENWLKQFV